MEINDLKDFTACIDFICEYLRTTLSKPMRKFYWKCLKEYAIADVKAAFMNYVKNPKKGAFFPKVSELVAEIDAIKEPEIPDEIKAMHAWDIAFKSIQNSVWNNPVFEDPLAEKTIKQMGGVKALGMTQEKDMVWKRKEFEQRYIAYLKHPILISWHKMPSIESTDGLKIESNSVSSIKSEQKILSFSDMIKKIT